MIDFRYHLISIVAVFLALGIGILMGSLVLGENLVKQLRRDLGGIEKHNEELQDRIVELDRRVEQNEEFSRLARRHLIDGQLEGEEIVLFTYEGLDGGLLDQVRTTVEEAGGRIVSTVEATDKLVLESPAERDQLALILSSADANRADLSTQLGTEVGNWIAEIAAQPPADAGPPTSSGAAELEELLADLQDAGFLAVDGGGGDEPMVTQGASFVLAGGSGSDPPFVVAEYSVGLANALASKGAPVVAVESSGSNWGLVTTLRVDDDAQRVVNTIDQAETVSGSVALVLTLEQAEQGIVGRHYGIESGAELLIPEPVSTP